MIYFDTTKAGGATHRSGLTRVSRRLLDELGANARPVRWPDLAKSEWAVIDWFFTAELFSEAERPGFGAFLRGRTVRTAALFHDAIPLKLPHITWPQSVARQPGYMKLLAEFDRVWAVSQASKLELEQFWRWQGVQRAPRVDVLPLGADFAPGPRAPVSAPRQPARLLMVGILEPRKNQTLLLEASERLWADGLTFEVHLVGRLNPHFGAPIAARIRSLRRAGRPLHWHERTDDGRLRALYADAHATVLPTIAEGCGLPLLESLWMGVPCMCSDLPVLRENAAGGGCLPVPVDDLDAWTEALRHIITDDALVLRLRDEASRRELPTWSAAASILRRELA